MHRQRYRWMLRGSLDHDARCRLHDVHRDSQSVKPRVQILHAYGLQLPHRHRAHPVMWVQHMQMLHQHQAVAEPIHRIARCFLIEGDADLLAHYRIDRG